MSQLSPSSELVQAIRSSDLPTVRSLLASNTVKVNELVDGALPLIEAVRAGVDFVQALLDHGARADLRDARGMTALNLAAEEALPRAVESLVNAGADPNLQRNNVVCPLTRTTTRRSADSAQIARTLLDAGADPNFAAKTTKTGERSMTLLMSAAQDANTEVVNLLVQAGARVNDAVLFGTALCMAVVGGDSEIVRCLLDAGADPTLVVPLSCPDKTLAGKTPLEIARAKGRNKLVSLLSGAAVKREQAPGTIAEAWAVLRQHLSDDIIRTLRPPARADEIRQLESALNQPLPGAVLDFLSLHDGQQDSADAPFIPGEGEPGLEQEFRLLSAPEMLAQWRIWQDVVAAREPQGQEVVSDTGVKAAWFDAGWLPIAENGAGDLYCADLAPAAGGESGQIINVPHDTASRLLVAPSLSNWFVEIARQISTLPNGA